MIPRESDTKILFLSTPSAQMISKQDIAAAPAPEQTTLISSIFLPVISKAFSIAAATMIEVPCWSSWNTGMFMRSRNSRSILKHSGALMSSRLIPPKVGSSEATASMNLSGSFWAISISKTSIPANFLNKTPLPSMTGLEANGPISPKPSTAVPLVITPTKLLRAVYLAANAGSL